MPSRTSPALVLLAVASTALLAQDQGPRPSFKTGVQLVRIDVSVLDDKRQPVRGLQASDFTVLEDGHPRPIRAFEAVDHAAATPAAVPSQETTAIPPPDVATNHDGGDTSRLIVIVMDRSISPERPMLIARQIADAAVDAMAPGDLAAIVTTGGGMPQNLTPDRARLHKAIAASDWSQTLSPEQMADPIVASLQMNDPLSDGRCLCGLCVMDTIAQIANQIRDVPRRKVLFFIGSNLIVQAGPRAARADPGCDTLVEQSREKLYDALQTSGLTVHSIDPSGLANIGPATRASVPNGIENRDGRALNQQLAQETRDFMTAQGNLDVLPQLTGGRTILNSNEPYRMVPEVLHESDAYYLLAFEPIEATAAPRHSVEIKVARKGVHISAPRFVAAPPAATTAAAVSPLDRALTQVLPDTSLPLSVAVASFASADPRRAYVGVTLDASAFAVGTGSMPIEIAVSASDERGRRVGGARQNGTVQVPRSAGRGVGLAPLVELQTYLALPPGNYELRTAVMNSDTRAASSVFTHVTVPPFDGDRLSVSDVVLGTRQNLGGLPDAAPAIPIVPTTARVFSAGEPAWAFLRVYRASEKGTTTPVSIDTSVLDTSGTRVAHQLLRAATFVGRNADVRMALPVKTLAPGRYVLRIEARQGRADASRAIAFAVTPAQAAITQEHSPELDAALAAAAAYLEQYEHRISAIGAEEEYAQTVQSSGNAAAGPLARPGTGGRTTPATAATRKTRANIMTISLGARGWVSFRDVFELDGRPVRDRAERLSRVLQNITPDSLEQARQIAAESGRYNLEPQGTRLNRTLNVPMAALLFLRGANQPRSSFRLGKPERIAGVECVTLQFTEQTRPRVIGTTDGAAAHGTFWIDMAARGRVIKTDLRLESSGAGAQSVQMQTAVTYTRVDKLDLWLPTVMDETYVLPAGAQTLTGRATYSDFREFKVTTTEGIR